MINIEEERQSSRYPYTFACDLIRTIVGCDEKGQKLSRSEASQIRKLFSEVTGTNDHDMAISLAEHYLENRSDYVDMALKSFTSNVLGGIAAP